MTIESYKEHFAPQRADVKGGKYISVFIIRKTESECIFRTDKEISNEITLAGKTRRDLDTQFARVYISKRKQVAPERRSGREILRKFGLLNKNEDGSPCEINSKKMCGKCADCCLYGSAIGDEGALKSHVVSDESFSMLPYDVVTTEHTFNAIYDTGTMIDASGKQSQALGTDEVVRPGEFFLDIETITDVTMDEFIYVLANITRTRRYGAMSSRLGKMSNLVIGIAFSNCELFANLEWTQETYDEICHELKVADDTVPDFPLDPDVVKRCAENVMRRKVGTMNGEVLLLDAKETAQIIDQVSDIYRDEKKLKTVLSRLA
nr:type I-D CRISPR-associated protein Cas7/Csc2 [Candidatus Sigynarchaeota archaeon]